MEGPFEIWYDDLRLADILLNKNMQIVGVVDWEFAYAAAPELMRPLGGCSLRNLGVKES